MKIVDLMSRLQAAYEAVSSSTEAWDSENLEVKVAVRNILPQDLEDASEEDQMIHDGDILDVTSVYHGAYIYIQCEKDWS